jgi:hypothetical protein
MNIEALWSVEFASVHGGFASGVLVLVSGGIYGGDSNFVYEGDYEIVDDEFRGTLHVNHIEPQRLSPTPARRPFTVKFSGRATGLEMALTGTLEEDPETELFIHLTRRSTVRSSYVDELDVLEEDQLLASLVQRPSQLHNIPGQDAYQPNNVVPFRWS